MKVKFTKKQITEFLNEMAYPASFSFDEFKNIQSYNGKVKYCEQRLQRIASGSARIVYKIDDEKVLKLAKNQKGVAQNNVEGDFAGDSMRPDILAQTFDFDRQNGYWIEMELAQKAKLTDFKNILGFPFDFVQFFCDKIEGEWNSRKNMMAHYNEQYNYLMEIFYDENYDKFPNWKWFNELAEYIRNFGISVGDIQRISSWGLVNRSGRQTLVIIDFGLNDDVYKTHYVSHPRKLRI